MTTFRLTTDRARLLQKMGDYLRYGYDKWMGGEIDPAKLRPFVKKTEAPPTPARLGYVRRLKQ